MTRTLRRFEDLRAVRETGFGKPSAGGVIEQNATFIAGPNGIGGKPARALNSKEQTAWLAGLANQRVPQFGLLRIETVLSAQYLEYE